MNVPNCSTFVASQQSIALTISTVQAGDPACGAAPGNISLRAEYSDTRDGRRAGVKWAFLQAFILFQKALVGR